MAFFMRTSKDLGGLWLCLAVLLMGACKTTTPEPNVNVPADVDLVISKQAEVTKNPSAYVGKRVFVQGKVKELLSDKAFVLNYDGRWRGNNLLVLRADDNSEGTIAKDTELEVVGDVELFNRPELERRLGRKLEANVFDQYQNQPFVMSSSILAH